MLPLVSWILIASTTYLIGSVPTGYLVGRWHHMDIRQHGSGNIGATNVLRVLGKGWGYLVFAADALKGLVGVKVGALLAAVLAGGELGVTLGGIIGAVSCILGHNYPVWLRFKGGKGVATSAGVLLGLFPLLTISLVLLIWLVVFYASRYVSLASIAAALALPLVVFMILPRGRADFLWLFGFAFLITVLAIWRHRSNIGRLVQGTESRFGKKP
jgi:acyl phosphate:glycerol-3-phosphate acyltransferase